jgi:hypothetical protein
LRIVAALAVLDRTVAGQPRIAGPPVDADLPGGLQRGDHQPQLDGEQFDVQQVHLDVAGDHQSLVQDAFQDVAQVGRLACRPGAHSGRLRDVELLARNGHRPQPPNEPPGSPSGVGTPGRCAASPLNNSVTGIIGKPSHHRQNKTGS